MLCGRILVTFVLKDGSKAEVKGELGDNILEVAHKNAIDLEGGMWMLTVCCCSQLTRGRSCHQVPASVPLHAPPAMCTWTTLIST